MRRSAAESGADDRLREIREEIAPHLGPHWNLQANLFVKRLALSRLLYLDRIYSLVLDVPGVICEFGVQWGATMATLINLRGIYEPYNYSRTIVGFDTFDGFTPPAGQDGKHVEVGDYATVEGYESKLEEVLALHEAFSPLDHMRKFQLVKGDAAATVPAWLDGNPHAVISLAIFDMDLYGPTKAVMAAIEPRLTKGSVLVFDELNCPRFPGETQAVIEGVGLGRLNLRRDPHQPYCAWAIWGD